MLNLAREYGLLDDSPRVAIPRGPGAPTLLAEVLMKPLGDQVRASFPREIAPFEVLVVPVAGLPRSGPREHAITDRVGRTAARRLMTDILKGGTRIVGISWGYHCWRVSRALPGGLVHRLEREAVSGIQFFPLVGSLGVIGEEARRHLLIETSANLNAARCVDNLERYGIVPRQGNDDEPAIDPPVQLTQPCVIPEEVANQPDLLEAIWQYIALDKSVQAIFGKSWALGRIGREQPQPADETLPLLHRADALVTGIGDLETSRAMVIGAIPQSLVDEARQGHAVGDISGHYICHADDYAECGEQLKQINRRVVAPTLAEYVTCTRTARMTGQGLGTFLVVNGRHKAEAVEAAISHGAANVLVCDAELAQEIVDRARRRRQA